MTTVYDDYLEINDINQKQFKNIMNAINQNINKPNKEILNILIEYTSNVSNIISMELDELNNDILILKTNNTTRFIKLKPIKKYDI